MESLAYRRLNPPYQTVSVKDFITDSQAYAEKQARIKAKREVWLRQKRTPSSPREGGTALRDIEARCQLDDSFQFPSTCFEEPAVFLRLKARHDPKVSSPATPEATPPNNPPAKRSRKQNEPPSPSTDEPSDESAGGNSRAKRNKRTPAAVRSAVPVVFRFVNENPAGKAPPRRRPLAISTKMSNVESLPPLPPTPRPEKPASVPESSSEPDKLMGTPSPFGIMYLEPTHPATTSRNGSDLVGSSTNVHQVQDQSLSKTTKAPTPTPAAPPTPPENDSTGPLAHPTRFDDQIKELYEMMDRSSLSCLDDQNQIDLPSYMKPEINYAFSKAAKSEITPLSIARTVRRQKKLPARRPISDLELLLGEEPLADDEVVLNIAVYLSNRRTNKLQEFQVLGRQYLTVLRDALFCMADFASYSGKKDNPNTATKKTSASFFFINQTFYSDDRDPDAIDYSQPIIDWVQASDARRFDPKFANLKTKPMSQTRFADLTLDLFTPYTFMHQGDCEHTLVITDVRKPIPLHDANNALVYPRQSFRCFQKRHRCRMCRNAPSDLVTADDFYSGQNPCFFCQNCYDLFHYGDKGELLYEYKVFPYVGGW